MKKVLILILLVSMGCASVQDIGYYTEISNSAVTDPHIIEINDKGKFHKKEQLSQLLSSIDKQFQNLHIVLFVHGWHHNAHPDDKNLSNFKKFINHLRANDNKHKTMGVYIGWRGEEKERFNLFTLITRKKVSNIIGSVGLKKILTELKKTLKNKNNYKVTVIGHSLGGSSVFHSVAQDIADGIFDYNKNFKFIMLNPALSTQEFETVKTKIINRKLDITKESPLIIMQSNKDWAVKWIFPVFTGSPAVGFSTKHMTHGSWACSKKDHRCIEKLEKKYQKKSKKCVKLIQNKTWYIHTNNYTNEFNKFSCEDSWRLPFIVIQNAPTISGYHNQILTSTSAKALLDLINK